MILLVSTMVTTTSFVLPVRALGSPVLLTSASYGTIGSYNVVKANLTNISSSFLDLMVFAVWKNSAAQTVVVTTGGLTLASAATDTAFAPLASPPPSGTYTVNVFTVATSTTSYPVISPTFSFSVTI